MELTYDPLRGGEGRGGSDSIAPEQHGGHDDLVRRNLLQTRLVRRYLDAHHGSIDQWVRRYAVIFGNLWDDQLRLEKDEEDGFRKFIYAEWEDVPQFFDQVQFVLDRVRREAILGKKDRRSQRKESSEQS